VPKEKPAAATPADHATDAGPAIVLGVTSDVSIRLLHGFPDYLAERGWTVHVVSAPGPLSDQLRARGNIHVHWIDMERRISVLKDFRALLMWLRLLNKLKPDVLYVGTPKAGLLGCLAGWLSGTPSRVYMLRGLRSEGLAFPWSSLLNVLERVAIWCAHEVVCVSRSLREAAYESAVLPAGRGVVLGAGSSNGVSTDHRPLERAECLEQRARYFGEPGRFTVGFVGRVTRDKGLDTLAAALSSLAQAGLSGNCLVVGGDDDPDSPGLRAALDGSGWSICHLGHVSEAVLAMSTLDVLCLPSRREGFPNVVLEAAMVGVPCIGSDATGVVDAVLDGVTGVTVPTDDARALAHALADLMMHPERRHRLGLSARRRAIAEFAREQVWAVQATFLASMLDGSSPVHSTSDQVHA
jgi:glycosyltransferase involved in cell wall biosynthesis